MRSFLFNSKVLIIVVMIFAVCSLSCKQKSSEQADSNLSQPAQTKIEAETKAEPETKTETTTSVEPTVPEEPVSNIAVTVNGVDITEEQLQKIIQPQIEQMTRQNKQLPPSFAQAFEKQVRQQMLDQLITRQLLEEKVKEANIVVTDEEVDIQIQKIAAAQRTPISIERLKTLVEAQGLVFEKWKNDMRKQMAQLKLFKSQSADIVNVTEIDAKKHYDDNPTQFVTKEQVRASHILINPKELKDAGSDPNQQKAKAKAKAEDLLKQIKQGADFAALATANSHCGSKTKGGDLGFFGKGTMTPPFEKAAFAMEPGKISDIVETQFGYHIIKVTDRKQAGTKTFEQAKVGLIQQLTQKKQADLINKYIESLKAAANIVYPPGKEPKSSPSPMMVPQSR